MNTGAAPNFFPRNLIEKVINEFKCQAFSGFDFDDYGLQLMKIKDPVSQKIQILPYIKKDLQYRNVQLLKVF